MKTLVIGLPGAGKSVLTEALCRRGIDALDCDEEISRWVDLQTGLDVGYQPPHPIDANRYAWNFRLDCLADRLERPHDVYACGNSGNIIDALPLIDQLVYLDVPLPELRRRLIERTTNSYGKAEEEWQFIVGWYSGEKSRWMAEGAVIIDASQPLHLVFGELLGLRAKRLFR